MRVRVRVLVAVSTARREMQDPVRIHVSLYTEYLVQGTGAVGIMVQWGHGESTSNVV